MTFENAYFTLEVFRNNLEFFHSKRSMKKNMAGASPNLAHDKLNVRSSKDKVAYLLRTSLETSLPFSGD